MANALILAGHYPIYKTDFILMDIKTNGLCLSKNRITSISLAHIKNGKLEKEWHIQLRQQSFKKIANQLQVFLKNKIIIAENIALYYSFLKHEMHLCDININNETICSVRLARSLFSEVKNHDLKSISRHLLFDPAGKNPLELLLNFFSQLHLYLTPEDFNKTLCLLLKNDEGEYSLTYKGRLPNARGIYRCYDKNNILIYVGQSESIANSVESIFKTNLVSSQKNQIAKQIKRIDWIKTQGELGTSLLASTIIKNDKPIFNYLTGKSKRLYTIQVENNERYLILKIVNISTLTTQEFSETMGIFKSEKDAEKLITFFINQGKLCHQVNSAAKKKTACLRYKTNECYGACNKQESPDKYNSRVNRIISTFSKNSWPFESKIAIKETCRKTNATVFHIVHNWNYIDTTNSISNINEIIEGENKMDIDIYLMIKKFIHTEVNQSAIIEIN